MTEVVFFDSHGNPWESCSADDRGAEAFGPTGNARRIEGLSYAEARDAGLVIPAQEVHEWDLLCDKRMSVEVALATCTDKTSLAALAAQEWLSSEDEDNRIKAALLAEELRSSVSRMMLKGEKVSKDTFLALRLAEAAGALHPAASAEAAVGARRLVGLQ